MLLSRRVAGQSHSSITTDYPPQRSNRDLLYLRFTVPGKVRDFLTTLKRFVLFYWDESKWPSSGFLWCTLRRCRFFPLRVSSINSTRASEDIISRSLGVILFGKGTCLCLNSHSSSPTELLNAALLIHNLPNKCSLLNNLFCTAVIPHLIFLSLSQVKPVSDGERQWLHSSCWNLY